jgi:hypothetical protein
MFELVRHFISRFFDSELVSSSAEWRPVLIGAFAMLVPAISLIAPGLTSKYKYLSKLGDASLFNLAVRADSLWIITLMMSVVGLLTAILLSSLFPDPHDYLILGSLPVRLWRIFAAKLTALLLVATVCIVAINSFVNGPLAFFTGGALRFNRSAAAHCIGQSAASIGASYFVFFAMIASQGLIMSLPMRSFRRFQPSLQGVLVGLTLVGAIMSFFIGPPVETALVSSPAGRMLPPVWFLGLYQKLIGSHDPVFTQLAGTAVKGLAAVIAVSVVAFALRNKRHQEMSMELTPTPPLERKWVKLINKYHEDLQRVHRTEEDPRRDIRGFDTVEVPVSRARLLAGGGISVLVKASADDQQQTVQAQYVPEPRRENDFSADLIARSAAAGFEKPGHARAA